jgi:hypothetical protein
MKDDVFYEMTPLIPDWSDWEKENPPLHAQAIAVKDGVLSLCRDHLAGTPLSIGSNGAVMRGLLLAYAQFQHQSAIDGGLFVTEMERCATFRALGNAMAEVRKQYFEELKK